MCVGGKSFLRMQKRLLNNLTLINTVWHMFNCLGSHFLHKVLKWWWGADTRIWCSRWNTALKFSNCKWHMMSSWSNAVLCNTRQPQSTDRCCAQQCLQPRRPDSCSWIIFKIHYLNIRYFLLCSDVAFPSWRPGRAGFSGCRSRSNWIKDLPAPSSREPH